MRTSGLILDMHDDLQGEVVRSIYPTIESVPGQVKTAHRLDASDLDSLPDDVFALVLRQGDVTLRKYACVDEGNTMLNVEYFLKTAHKLPKEAAKLAAQNLMVACDWYGLEAPEELQKVAFWGTLANIGGKVLNWGGKAMTAVQGLGAAKDAVGGIKNTSSAIGSGIKGIGHFSSASDKMAAAKEADVTFTETMPAASSRTRNPEQKKAVITKTGAAAQQFGSQERGPHSVGHQADPSYPEVNAPHGKPEPISHEQDWDFQLTHGEPSGRQFKGRVMSPNIEVTGKDEPEKPLYEKKASRHALDGRYPLDNLVQIKRASAYFDEFGCRMSPAQRREYCVNMVKAAGAIGIEVSDEALKYGAERYAPAEEMKLAMDVRKRALVDEQSHQVLDRLFEKRATMHPDLYCKTLELFDHKTGLNHYYDQYVPDPYWSTYGIEKRAEFLETIGNDSVTEQALRQMVEPGHNRGTAIPALARTFGADFAEEFRKDPVGIFKSMPRDQKLFIMRLANDNGPSSLTSV